MQWVAPVGNNLLDVESQTPAWPVTFLCARDENRTRREVHDVFRNGPENEATQPLVAVGAHHDAISIEIDRQTNDVLCRSTDAVVGNDSAENNVRMVSACRNNAPFAELIELSESNKRPARWWRTRHVLRLSIDEKHV